MSGAGEIQYNRLKSGRCGSAFGVTALNRRRIVRVTIIGQDLVGTL
jgi:hypothetical protein